MFANRFTVVVDACSLAPALKRNLLLSLAAGEFFRIQWSVRILDEVERAISGICEQKGMPDGAERGARARSDMERAFEGAFVTDYEHLLSGLGNLPDADDAHVIAAAFKVEASVIVTENLRHFPEQLLKPLGLEAKCADEFIADTIDLDPGRAVATVRRMRQRLKRPEKTPEALLLDMEAAGLTLTVDILRDYVLLL